MKVKFSLSIPYKLLFDVRFIFLAFAKATLVSGGTDVLLEPPTVKRFVQIAYFNHGQHAQAGPLMDQ